MTLKCVIRGDPVRGVEELLGPDGRGKTVLGERRVPQEKALAYLAEVTRETFPDRTIVWAEDGVLPDVSGDCIVFIPNVRTVPGIDEWAEKLGDDVIVICGQEICHQVTTLFRIH